MSCQVYRSSNKEIMRVTAPNGEDSQLFRDIQAMTGDREKSLRIWAQVYTPSFTQWFGDWRNDPQNASKVVDKNGEPLMVYHGTPKEFNKFNTKSGTYFSIHKEDAKYFAEDGGNVMPLFLNFKDPYVNSKSVDEYNDEEYQQAIEHKSTIGHGFEYVAFEPNQIKSVTNQGTFSKDNNNIYFNRKQETQALHDKGVEVFDKVISQLSNSIGKSYQIITGEQAKEITKNSPVPWNGEKAFAFGNQVYILKDGMSVENAIHEYGHFFLDAIDKTNSSLIDKVYKDLVATSEGGIIDRDVRGMYTDFSERDIQKETLTRALTTLAQDRFESEQPKSILGKIWYAVKRLFRSVFGATKNMDSLNGNTTLREMADLLTNPNFKIDSKIVDSKDIANYNREARELIQDLNKLDEGTINSNVNKFYNIVDIHYKNILSNPGYKDVKETTTNESDRNQFAVLRDLLKSAKDGEEAVDFSKKIKQLAHTISGVELLTSKILDRIEELNDSNDEQNKLATLSYYGYMLSEWGQFMSNFRKELSKTREVDNKSDLFKTVASIESNIRTAQDEIRKNDESESLSMLNSVLRPVKEELQAAHEANIKRYTEDLNKGNKSAQKFIDDENDRYKKWDLSPENLQKYLRGEMGDSNPFSGLLEAYISNSDPIIGGFAKFLKGIRYDVEATARNFDLDMRRELEPHYKAAGIDRSKPAELGKVISFVDKTLRFEKGVPMEGETVSLLNPFKNHRYDIDLLNHKIEKLTGEKKFDEARQVRKELNQLLADYFHREYVDAYYKLQDIWKTDIGGKAKERRDEIYSQINDIQNTLSKVPHVRDAELEQVKELRKELQRLGSLRDLNGNPKTGEDLEIAKVIKQYREESLPFYDSVEIKGLFETKYNDFKQSLIDDGLTRNSDEYALKLDNWLKENTRRVITKEFYDTRKTLMDQISNIINKLPGADDKSIDLKLVWNEIIDIVKGYRDDDGQPIGSDLNEAQIAKVKDLQEKIQTIQERYAKLSGLNDDEQDELNQLIEKSRAKLGTKEESERIDYLLQKKQIQGLSKLDKSSLLSLINQLKALSSKVATEYYTDVVNNYFNKIDFPPITEVTADVILTPSFIDPLLEKDEDFKKWFNKNHITKTIWDPIEKELVPKYERLYVWNRIQPNDPKGLETTILSDGTKITGLPSYDYYRRLVKNEYRTKRVVGKTVDNKGNWLPKSVEDGAKDSKYRNEAYHDLQRNDPTKFKILNIMTKYHLKAQDGLYNSNKLWMDVPRYRKNGLEDIQSGKLKEDLSSGLNKIKNATGALIGMVKRGDDFQLGNANYDKDLTERLVSADMFDNEISRVPIKGLSMIPVNQVSLNIGESIIKHMVSAETNKKMVAINPIAKALINTVEENGIKDIRAINRRNYFARGEKTFINSKKNNRLQTLTNLYEREFEGIEHKLEIGEFGNKAANLVMKVAAHGSLALDGPGALKNVFAANVQSFIEALNGKHITRAEFRLGTAEMISKFIPAMIADYNKLDGLSMETQLYQMFDPVQGKFKDKLGHALSASNLANFVAGHWMFAPREFGEIEAQGSFWRGMMKHQKIEQTIDGITKEIGYDQAFEFVNGRVQLKAGIDKEWGESGEKFKDFKLKLHELNQKLQGNYADIDQSELQRYTLGRLFNFMKRFLVPAATNRFSTERLQVGMGATREGYYVTSLRVAGNFIKTAKLNWHLYSAEEKGNVWKTLGELATSLTFYLLLRCLGWDPNDKDKYHKLQDNSWATNELIYQLMAVKSESEQFIPIPGMGLDELMRLKNTPSIAFGHLDKYYKLVTDLMNYTQVGMGIEPSDELYLSAKQGIWDEGTPKIVPHLARLFGFTGGTISPEVQIKNFNLIQSRTK